MDQCTLAELLRPHENKWVALSPDICGVDIKTVHRFQHVAAHRAQAHHAHVTCELGVEGMPRDERHATRRGPHGEWLPTALAMRRRFMRWGHGGPRTQESAALLLAQGVARLCGVPVGVSDGGNADPAALWQVLGRVFRRRHLREPRVKDLLMPALEAG